MQRVQTISTPLRSDSTPALLSASASEDFNTSSPPIKTPNRVIKQLHDPKNATLPGTIFTNAADQARFIALTNQKEAPSLDDMASRQIQRSKSVDMMIDPALNQMQFASQQSQHRDSLSVPGQLPISAAQLSPSMYNQAHVLTNQLMQANMPAYIAHDGSYTPSPTLQFANLPMAYSSAADGLTVYHPSLSRSNSPVDPTFASAALSPYAIPAYSPNLLAQQMPSRQPSPLPVAMAMNNLPAALPPSHEWSTQKRKHNSTSSEEYAASEGGSEAAGSSMGSEYMPEGQAASSPLSVPRHDMSIPMVTGPGKRKKPQKESSDSDYMLQPLPASLRISYPPVPPPDHGKQERATKPPYSYAALIGQAIMNNPTRKLSLNDIYLFIMHNYPFYRKQDAGWQNSIRHNLSLNQCFIKTCRDNDNPGKGSLWTIVSGCEHQFEGGGFVKKGGTATKKKAGSSKPLNLSLPPPSFEADMKDIKPESSRKRMKKSESTPALESPVPLETETLLPPPAVAARHPSVNPEAGLVEVSVAPAKGGQVEEEPDVPVVPLQLPASRLRRKSAGVHYFDSPPLSAAESEKKEPVKKSKKTKALQSSPGTIPFNSPAFDEHRFDTFSHPEITAELLSSPVAKRTDPEVHALATSFLPPVQLQSPHSAVKSMFAFDNGLSGYYSALTKSPTSCAREGKEPMPNSPLRHFRSGSSPPSLSAHRLRYDSDSEDEDMEPSSRPLSAQPEMETPSRGMKSPSRGIGIFGATGSSRALQSLQNEHGSPMSLARRTFTGFGTPGRSILSSPGPLFGGEAYSDPYDLTGNIGSELDRFEDVTKTSPRISSSRYIPMTPKFDTPRFHSSSLYSPW